MSWARRTAGPSLPLDINRETVVQLYFQSSLSRELRFCDDQPVKLLRLPPSTPVPRYIVRGDSLSVSFFLRYFPEREPEKRQKAEEEEKRKGKLAEHRMEYRHSLNYFLVAGTMIKINPHSYFIRWTRNAVSCTLYACTWAEIHLTLSYSMQKEMRKI